MLQRNFYTDKKQDKNQTIFDISKAIQEGGKDQEQRSQTQDSEDVGTKNDERIPGNTKDSRDAVKGKHNIGQFDHDHRKKQRCHHEYTADPGDEMGLVGSLITGNIRRRILIILLSAILASAGFSFINRYAEKIKMAPKT